MRYGAMQDAPVVFNTVRIEFHGDECRIGALVFLCPTHMDDRIADTAKSAIEQTLERGRRMEVEFEKEQGQ